MGLLSSVTHAAINAVDEVMLRYSRLTKGRLVDYCPFDTPIDDTTLVTERASLVSFIEVGGTLSAMGEREFITAAHALEVLFNGILATPGHSLQWVFTRSPSQTELQLTRLFSPLQASAARQAFDEHMVEQLFSERMQTLKKAVVAEACLLAFMTHPAALSTIEKKEQAHARQTDARKKQMIAHKVPLKMGQYAQSVTASLSRLHETHRAALNGFMQTLTTKPVMIEATILNCHQALSGIRQQIQPSLTAPDWKPVLPGDPLPLRAKPWVNAERDHLFYPVIGSQLFSQTASIIGNVVKSGEQYETTVSMSLPPQEPRRFDALFAAIPTAIDWRYSLHCLGGDTIFAGKVRTRRNMAKIFRVGNSDYNEAVINGCEHLLALRSQGELLGGLRLQISIRATSMEAVRQQSQRVARILQGWGNCDTTVERGDPFDALVATLPGMDSKATGTTLIQPMRESTLIAPITRPVSPWQEFGTELYTTLDGKIYPMQACSRLQHTWVSLYYGPPGSGKSLAMNARNLNLCLTPGLSQLPRIAILDIGPSSEGLILLLQALLPSSRKGEAVHKTLKQSASSAINPLDTLLGMRFPHNSKRNFIKSFLLLLFTADGEKKVKAGIGELVSALITETYKYYSDEGQPKRYTPHTEPTLDTLIEENPDWFYPEKTTATQQHDQLTWWQVTDALAEKGLFKEAGLAQRYAVPLIGDLTAILHSTQALKDVYVKTAQDAETSQHLIKMIRSAINEYPILAHPTQFNVGQARVVALDLADVTGSGSTYNRKKTGLMYMLGREVTLGSLYFDDDDVKALPVVYKRYHQRHINQSLGDIKRVCMDEYHRTDGIEAIVSQIEQDIREARKYKVELVLGSQRFKDYTDTMITLATNIFMCNGAAGTELDDMCRTFHLGPSEKDLLLHKVHGAGKDGATFMLRCETKKGRFTQVLVNRVGVIELWALTSTAEDRLLRKLLLKEVPYFQALKLLANAFSDGSCQSYVEERVKDGDTTTEQVIEQIVTTLVAQFQQGDLT